MSPKAFLLLGVATLAAVGLATGSVLDRDLPVQSNALNEPLFEGLVDRLNDVSIIEVTAAGETTTVRHGPAGWIVEQRDGYPADPEKIRALALGIAQLHLIEPRTDREERLPRLELGDPADADARARLVRLENEEGEVLASIVVGKTSYGLYGPGRGGAYVRRAGEHQAWLADRTLPIPDGPLAWLDRRIVDLPRDRLAEIELVRPDGQHLAFSRSADGTSEALHLEGVPEGREEDPEKIERLASVLDKLDLQDVRRADGLDFPEDGPEARYRTVEGLVVEVDLLKEQDGEEAIYWARLTPSAGEPVADAMAEPEDGGDAAAGEAGDREPLAERVDALAHRLDGWAFKISRYLGERLGWQREEFLKPAESTS